MIEWVKRRCSTREARWKGVNGLRVVGRGEDCIGLGWIGLDGLLDFEDSHVLGRFGGV